MFRKHVPLVLVAASLLFPGCLENTGEEDPWTSKGADSSFLSGVVLSDCLVLGTSIDDPSSKQVQELPEGWRYDSLSIPFLVYEFWHCDYIASGPYERNHTTLLIESNFGPEAPSSCITDFGTRSTAELVRGAWISDSDLANYFRDEYDLPVNYMNFEIVPNPTPGTHFSLQWAQEGAKLNTLNFHGTPDESVTAFEENPEWFWDTAAGLRIWKAQHTVIDHLPRMTHTTGMIVEPHRNSIPTHPSWIGPNVGVVQAGSEISQLLFEDTLCEEPSS